MTSSRHPFLLLFLLALLVLLPGIGEPTALTGKDEFFLGLRTPMEMIAGDHWLVPFLDGVPRIRKPPFLYWLGRGSFEIFGISLESARLLAVLFAALLVVASAGIAQRLSNSQRTGFIAGGILLGCLGIASEGRRFMLDVPVAALSTAAFWTFLIWLDSRRWRWLTATSLLLAAGFLSKGPIVALVFGGGILGLLAARRLSPSELLERPFTYLLHVSLFAALALPWFLVVRSLFPEAVEQVLSDELASRQFFDLSPGIVLGLLNIALPWVFVFMAAAWSARWRPGTRRLALVWFLATFLPFLFIKSFDRYLIGSLVPLSLLLAISLPELRSRLPFRLGLIVALLAGFALAAFTFWFQLGGWYWLLLPAVYFSRAWWQDRGLGHTLAAPAIFWMALLWGVFPAIGVNAVPPQVIELGKASPLAFFDGPQPALLPILTQQAHRHYGQLDPHVLAELRASGSLIFLEEKDISRFQQALTAANLQAQTLGSYQTLASHGSGLRFIRPGSSRQDWETAIIRRDLSPLKTRIYWFRITP